MEGVRILSYAAAGVAAVAIRSVEIVPWIRRTEYNATKLTKKKPKKRMCPVGDSNSGFLGHNEGY